MEEFLSALLVFGFSTVKFLSGIAASLGFQQGLLPSYVSTVGGGILGVFAFTFFGEILKKESVVASKTLTNVRTRNACDTHTKSVT